MSLAKLITTLVLSFFTLNSYAFKFTPMVADLEIGKLGNKLKYSVQNNSDKTIAVQVRAVHRRIDEEGREYRKDAKDDFLIFPSQLFLKGNEKRSVLVRYKGEQNPNNEKAYRIIAEQVDVNAKENKKLKEGANLKILLRYVASLYVGKEQFKGEVNFSGYHFDQKNKVIKVVATNKGKKRVVLERLQVRVLKNKSEVYRYKSEDLKGFQNEVVQASASRKFTLPLKNKIPTDGSAKFEITY